MCQMGSSAVPEPDTWNRYGFWQRRGAVRHIWYGGWRNGVTPTIAKISHRDFQLPLVREMLARAGHEPRPSSTVGRLALASTNISGLDIRHNKHWSGCNLTKRRYRVCSERGVTRTVRSKCVKCEVALCVDRACFTITQRTHCNNYFGPSSVQIAEASIKM